MGTKQVLRASAVSWTMSAARPCVQTARPSWLCPPPPSTVTVSRIVPVFEPGTTVTTTRTDVHYIVTEYGVANLRGQEPARARKAPDQHRPPRVPRSALGRILMRAMARRVSKHGSQNGSKPSAAHTLQQVFPDRGGSHRRHDAPQPAGQRGRTARCRKRSSCCAIISTTRTTSGCASCTPTSRRSAWAWTSSASNRAS